MGKIINRVRERQAAATARRLRDYTKQMNTDYVILRHNLWRAYEQQWSGNPQPEETPPTGIFARIATLVFPK